MLVAKLLYEPCEVVMVNVAFIGQRHETAGNKTNSLALREESHGTGLSGEIRGRYGHDMDAYPRENCIAPRTPLSQHMGLNTVSDLSHQLKSGGGRGGHPSSLLLLLISLLRWMVLPLY